MGEQRELFGIRDKAPKMGTILKKVITKERLQKAKEIYRSGDHKQSAAILRDLNDKLELMERRISNKDTADGVRGPAKTVRRAGI